jgi:hypothetical protein
MSAFASLRQRARGCRHARFVSVPRWYGRRFEPRHAKPLTVEASATSGMELAA